MCCENAIHAIRHQHRKTKSHYLQWRTRWNRQVCDNKKWKKMRVSRIIEVTKANAEANTWAPFPSPQKNYNGSQSNLATWAANCLTSTHGIADHTVSIAKVPHGSGSTFGNIHDIALKSRAQIFVNDGSKLSSSSSCISSLSSTSSCSDVIVIFWCWWWSRASIIVVLCRVMLQRASNFARCAAV